MLLNAIKTQIFKFLSTDKPEVMAIKGNWGVGKTYSWKKFLKEANKNEGIALDRYSYISLFGINSLEMFKYTIFENVVTREMIGTEANIETFKKNATGLIESIGRRSVHLIRSAPIIKDLNPAIETISFLSLNKTLICIDDLERKGANLEIRDILGLVSLLKEQKKCKVVLLLNANETGLEQYTKYREKVIDIELQFEPNPEECASLVYSQHPNFDQLKKNIKQLDINNIRILKKIENLLSLSLPFVKECEPELTEQLLHSAILFSWSYYLANSNEKIPKLDYILYEKEDLLGLGGKEENKDPNKKIWKTTLQAYGYTSTDKLDLIIAEAVKTGYLFEDDLKNELQNINKKIIDKKSIDSYRKAWSLYHNSFDDNADEVIKAISESIKKNYALISPSELNEAVTLFRQLEADEECSKLIDFYISQRKNENKLFKIEGNYDRSVDSEIKEKFEKLYKETNKQETVGEVLKRISELNGWNPIDEIFLKNTTVDEYYDFFKSEKGDRLKSYISICLRFGQFANASERQKEIESRAIEALKRIGRENKINQLRLRKFDIEVD